MGDTRIPHPGWRARDLDVTTARRLNADLCSAKYRMAARHDRPLWFLATLDDCIERSNSLLGALKRYRDDLLKHIPERKPEGKDHG